MKRCPLLAVSLFSSAVLSFALGGSASAQSESSGPKPIKRFPIRSYSTTPPARPIRQAARVPAAPGIAAKSNLNFGTGPAKPQNDPLFGTGPVLPKNDPDFGTGEIKQAAGEEQTTRSGSYDSRIGRAFWQETTTDPKSGKVKSRIATEIPFTNRTYEERQSYDPTTATITKESVRGDRSSGTQTELRASENLMTGERSRTVETTEQTPWGTRRVLRTQTIDPITGQRRIDRGQSFAPPGAPASEPAIGHRFYYDPFTGVYHHGLPAVNAWPRPIPAIR